MNRKGRHKLIRGSIRDPHWYTEPTEDRVATSDDSLLHWIIEAALRFLEGIFGDGPMDVPADIAINMILFQVWSLKRWNLRKPITRTGNVNSPSLSSSSTIPGGKDLS